MLTSVMKTIINSVACIDLAVIVSASSLTRRFSKRAAPLNDPILVLPEQLSLRSHFNRHH